MPPMRPPKGAMAKAKKGTLKRLLKILFKKFSWQLIFSAICIVLYSLANIASSIFMSLITSTLENFLVDPENINPWPTLIGILIGVGVIYAIGLFAAFGYNLTMSITSQKFLNYLRKEITAFQLLQMGV